MYASHTSISIGNLIIEPWHFVEEVNYKDFIVVEFVSNILSDDIFDIHLKETEVLLNIEFDLKQSYQLKLYINNILVFAHSS